MGVQGQSISMQGQVIEMLREVNILKNCGTHQCRHVRRRLAEAPSAAAWSAGPASATQPPHQRRAPHQQL